MNKRSRSARRGAREEVARVAARIMVAESLTSVRAARDRAVRRLGLEGLRDLPRPREIEAALREYQFLFDGDAHAERLDALLSAALEAMRFFERFRPRLVGPVLNGAATSRTPVTLHLFSDAVEDVVYHLMNHRIPYRSGERGLRFADGSERRCPSFGFLAGDTEVEVVVFAGRDALTAPVDPADGKPLERASLSTVQALLAAPEGRAAASSPDRGG